MVNFEDVNENVAELLRFLNLICVTTRKSYAIFCNIGSNVQINDVIKNAVVHRLQYQIKFLNAENRLC